MRNAVCAAAAVLVLVPACADGPSRTGDAPAAPRSAAASWKKPRYISVRDAVRRLQPHVDVPVVLPRDPSAGLADLDGWLADPDGIEWRRAHGVRVGGLELRKGRRILLLSYGLASFDGCGDRTTAEEAEVLGQPALVSDSEEYRWSEVLWPVTNRGSTGRYGIAGTWPAEEMIRLAESMEAARLRAVSHRRGC